MAVAVEELGSPRIDISNDNLDLDVILQAAETACPEPDTNACDVILRAAGAMPADASDFDRGLAAGVALGRFLGVGKKN